MTAGLLACLGYQSFEYAVFWAHGPLYPVYVATLALGLSALGLIVSHAVFVLLILAGLWLPISGRTLGRETTGDALPASSLH